MWLTKAWVDVFGLQAAVDVLEKDFMRTVTRIGLKFHRDMLGPMVAQTGLADAQKEALTNLYGPLQALARDVSAETYSMQVSETARRALLGGVLWSVDSAEERLGGRAALAGGGHVWGWQARHHGDAGRGSAVVRLGESDFHWLFASEIAYTAA